MLVGVGIPNLACNLARHTHSPGLNLVYESGVVGAVPGRVPLSIGDPGLVSGSLMVGSMLELFQYLLQGGRVDAAMLGTAQIDRYGNLNTTVVGSYEKPKVRLPGSGGAVEIAAHARKIIVLTKLDRRTFVRELDFRTSAGHLDIGQARERWGMKGGGPQIVISDKAVFAFPPETRQMTLTSLYPDVDLDEIRALIDWDFQLAREIGVARPPTGEELAILRGELGFNLVD